MDAEGDKKYSAAEQREALQWLVDMTIPPLQILTGRGVVSDADLAKHLPALQALMKTLEYLEKPWVREAFYEIARRGPPR